MRAFKCDRMPVTVYDSNEALGAAAAHDLAGILRQAVAERGEASVILATGNSQLTFINVLRDLPGIPWDKISIFHMDEYLGMAESHPASFRRYLKEKLANHVALKAFYGVPGDAADVKSAVRRYADLLAKSDPVACILGIGENGHLAFNDPPCDFDDPQPLKIVTLAETARRQQVGEGHFPTLDDVPRQAITVTVPALLRPQYVLALVPEARKAPAVKAALEGPVTPDCPASILRTKDNTKLYLDPDSASLL